MLETAEPQLDKGPNSEHVVTYFHPRQVVFLVEGTVDGESTRELIEWANTIAGPRGAEISDPLPLRFPPPPEQEPDLQLMALHAQYLSAKGRDSRTTVDELDPFTLISANVTAAGGSNQLEANDLLDLILLIDRRRKQAPGNRLEVVSPNWLVSGSRSEPGGTGGPGDRPVAYQGSANTTAFEFKLDTLPQALYDQAKNGKQGEGVVVAILDTVPQDSLAQIYDAWVGQHAEEDQHSLLKSLLRTNDRVLHVIRDPYVDVPSPDIEPDPPGLLQADNHDYLMSDHGLFVAGIIHSIAPNAKIYLFEVLNRYGVGDFMSIARGLQNVLRLRRYLSEPIVVNLSWTLNLPLEKGHNTTDNRIGKEIGEKILRRKPSWLRRQARALERICRSINKLRSNLVIAAAGNKRKKGQSRPHALYPAAFPSVWGVGALPYYPKPPANPQTRLKTASYSNFSDRPRGSGIATLGGEKEKGILGIYVGEFPPKDSSSAPTPSINGWAWWCGTSFATAAISGMAAAILSNILSGGTSPRPRRVIRRIRRAQPYFTQEDEDLLFLTQG